MNKNERYIFPLSKFTNQEDFFNIIVSKSIPELMPTDSVDPNLDAGFIRLGDITEIETSSQYRIPTTHDFFLTRVLLGGPSNTIKTFFAGSLGFSLATGSDFYFLKKSSPIPIALLSGEEDSSSIKERINQIKGKSPEKKSLLDKNFWYYDLQEKNLTKTEEQQKICEFCKKKGIRLVILDNLLSTLPKTAQGSTDVLSNFIQMLKSNNISIIIVHHTNKEGHDFKGPVELVALSRNIIKLHNSQQIMEQAEKKLLKIPENVLEAMNYVEIVDGQERKNVVALMEITKCKASRALEGMKKFFILPIKGDLQCIDAETGAETSLIDTVFQDEVPSYEAEFDTVLEDNFEEQKVQFQSVKEFSSKAILEQYYEKIQETFSKNDFKRKDIERLFGCKRSKASDIISELIDNKLIEKESNGNQTHYRAIGKE